MFAFHFISRKVFKSGAFGGLKFVTLCKSCFSNLNSQNLIHPKHYSWLILLICSAVNFIVHKSNRIFSAKARDQAYEMTNAVIKGDGGAIVFAEDPSALKS